MLFSNKCLTSIPQKIKTQTSYRDKKPYIDSFLIELLNERLAHKQKEQEVLSPQANNHHAEINRFKFTRITKITNWSDSCLEMRLYKNESWEILST